MTDRQRPQEEHGKEPELKRPEQAVKDLEAEKHEADAVTGGSVGFTQQKKIWRRAGRRFPGTSLSP